MKIDIVTLTYNGLEENTIPFINSLYKYTDINDFNLIVVDNGSSDGTKDYLEKLCRQYKNVQVIFNEKNVGYSAGNNQGMELAEEELVGLFNNDILMTPDWIKPIFEIFEKEEDAGMVSPTMLIEKRTLSGIYCKRKNYLSYASFLRNSCIDEYAETYDVQFSCVILKREMISKVGMLDENFSPAFFEDDDYLYRVSVNGYKKYVSQRSYFFHACGKTSSIIATEIFERNLEYLKNKEYLAYKYNLLYNENERFKYDIKYTCFYWLKHIVKMILKKE